MLFKRRFDAGIADGSITLTFRRWSRPQARAGGRYRLQSGGAVEVDAIARVRPAQVSAADAVRAGFPDRAALLDFLAKQRGADNGPLYRIEFHYLRRVADPRAKLAANAALSPDDARALAARLDTMDARSANGPWTRATLSLIAKRPRVVSTELARRLGMERAVFKTNVRKLKELGLTESLEVGYRLSPRGQAYLRATARPRRP
jgi:hypothetical protein